jgi:hypothetical protein
VNFRVGEVVERAASASLGLSGSVARGAKGVILREPGLLSKGYVVRLDAGGRQLELPTGALRRAGDVWSSSPAAKPAAPAPAEPPWWRHRSSAASTAPGRRGASSPPLPTPPVVRATSTWRSPGAVDHRLPTPAPGGGGCQPGSGPTRRSAAEAVEELSRRLGRRRGRGEGSKPC